jgi:hypothetical protein
MSNPVGPIEGAGTYGAGEEILQPKTEPNGIADRSYAGTDSDLEEVPMQSDDDLDIDQEDPMAAQYADTVKQIGMSGGAFLRMID